MANNVRKKQARKVKPAPRKKPKRKVNKRNLWTVILMFLVCLEIIVGVFGGAYTLKLLSTKPELKVDDFFSPESSRIYDKDGNSIADVGMQLRENVTYNELSESLIDAFLATEDSRYFTHDGFDEVRFTKAILENLKTMHFTQGGSTFTMQLVKVTYFTNDETGERRKKSIEYKVQQIALAKELEKKANKKQIFEMYLNKLNFGGNRNIRGIQKAAEYYYGKSADALNLPEAAMLAGVINSPYYYDPHNFLDYATKRRNTVLHLMLRHGYIDKQEYNMAKNVKVEDLLIDPNTTVGTNKAAFAYQSYIDTVIQEASQLTGQDPLTTAMDIYTYMDTKVQTVMDNIQAGKDERVKFPDELMECAMISENNQTGEIVAIGGGRNYGRGGAMLLNHATQQFKQPGSSVKPFLDYAMAFEYLGWSTSHVITDKPINYRGTDLIIQNASGKYYGDVTLKFALGISLNTPAIQALQESVDKAGWKTIVNYITSLGFSKVSPENFDLGFAIGGSNFICSAEELMAAHAVLMNGGHYIKPHTISKITYRNGMNDPVIPTYEKKKVLSPEAAFLASQLMYDVVHTQYYNFMHILNRNYPTYGKSGTSDWGKEGVQYNIPKGASKDKWMVSETSMYTTVVWLGYEKGVKDKNTYFNQAKTMLNIPGQMSNAILSALTDDKNPKGVEKPEGVTEITHILGTFPYAKPLENMDPKYITTGYIKKENAELVDPEQAKVESLKKFDVTPNDDGTISFEWEPYPDEDAMKVAPETRDNSLKIGDEVKVEASGKRLFDYSWVFGPMRYKAVLKQNGEVRGEISTDQPKTTQKVDLLPGIDVECCGFYGYESSKDHSNEMCQHFKAPDISSDSITENSASDSEQNKSEDHSNNE